MERELDEAKQLPRKVSSPWQQFAATDDDKLSNETREREASELVEQVQHVQMELVRVKEQCNLQVEQLQKQLNLKSTTLQALVSHYNAVVSMVASSCRSLS